MLDQHYTYLVAITPFALLWILLYAKRKDLRKEMLMVGVLWMFMCVASDYAFWIVDYWHPLDITNTRIPYIEDLLFGFFAGGVAAVLYEGLFRKRHMRVRATHAKRPLSHRLTSVMLILATASLFPFYILHLTSFYSSTIAFCAVGAFMFFFRRDLFIDGLLGGILLALFSITAYALIHFVSPQWIQDTYAWNTLSGIRVGGVPIEEFVFWFFSGFIFGPLYEFWQGERLVKTKR